MEVGNKRRQKFFSFSFHLHLAKKVIWNNRRKRLQITSAHRTIRYLKSPIFVTWLDQLALRWLDIGLFLLFRSCCPQFRLGPQNRGTQRQFSESICSEDDLRSRIFRTFVVKFLACLPLFRIFEHLNDGTIVHFQRIYTLKRSPRIFGSLFSG